MARGEVLLDDAAFTVEGSLIGYPGFSTLVEAVLLTLLVGREEDAPILAGVYEGWLGV